MCIKRENKVKSKKSLLNEKLLEKDRSEEDSYIKEHLFNLKKVTKYRVTCFAFLICLFFFSIASTIIGAINHPKTTTKCDKEDYLGNTTTMYLSIYGIISICLTLLELVGFLFLFHVEDNKTYKVYMLGSLFLFLVIMIYGGLWLGGFYNSLFNVNISCLKIAQPIIVYSCVAVVIYSLNFLLLFVCSIVIVKKLLCGKRS
jgi:hypothetical protein